MNRVSTQELTRSFRMARSTFDELCNAAGPLVVPATSCFLSCDLQRRKKCFIIVLFAKYLFFGIAQKTTSCEHKNYFAMCTLFCGIEVFSFLNVNVNSTRSEFAVLDYEILPVGPVVL